MAKFCGKCGTPLNSTAVFCGGCGTRVPAGSPPPPAVATPVQAPYVPPPANLPPASAVAASEQAGFAAVPVAFSTAETPAADPTAFTSVPASFTPIPPAFSPPPEPPPQPAGFAPVQGDFAVVAPPPAPPAFSPAPTAPAPAGYAPVQANFAAVPFAPAVAQAYTPAPAAYAPTQPSYAPPPTTYAPAPVYTPATAYPPAVGAKKSNTLLKVIVAFVVIIFFGGALALGGLWYAAQKIKEKAHAVATQALGGNSAAGSGLGQMLGGIAGLKASDDTAGFKGDPCRFLSKVEVSQAVGIQVIRTEAQDDSCSYIAHGDPADVTAKHMSSMLGGLGADPKAQKQIQKLAGGFFAQQEANDKDLRAQAATGEITVLAIRYTVGNAEAEMKMNRGAFTYVTGGQGTASSSGSGTLDGIGDEAYLAGGSMLIFRKGNSVAHFTYISCPCNTDNIKPLAKLVASRL